MKRAAVSIELTVVMLFLVAVAAIAWAEVSRSAELPAPAWRTPRVWTPPMARPASAADASLGAGRAAMIVGRDADSGVLGMPDDAQRARYAQGAVKVGAARPAAIQHLDGSYSMDTRSWMREFSFVRIAPKQKPAYGCLDDRASAVRAMHAPLPAAAATEER